MSFLLTEGVYLSLTTAHTHFGTMHLHSLIDVSYVRTCKIYVQFFLLSPHGSLELENLLLICAGELREERNLKRAQNTQRQQGGNLRGRLKKVASREAGGEPGKGITREIC